MQKHNLKRLFFIIMLGALLPLLAGFASLDAPFGYVAGTIVYFTIFYGITWAGCRLVLQPLRGHGPLQYRPFARMLVLCSISAGIASAVIGGGAALWLAGPAAKLVAVGATGRLLLFSAVAAVGFTLLFESVYLAEEKRQEHRRARRLQQQYQRAELDVLRNQLEPHFMANALTNLLVLIGDDPVRAQQFARKLAQVDEYFLRNRDNNLVTLAEELRFVEDYYFLLSIRHQGRLVLEIDIPAEEVSTRRIVPCALQIPIENAIKHNVLSSESPLLVRIALEGEVLTVSNSLRPKPYLLATTHLGLHNLSERYRLACRKAIDVCKTAEEFIVRLPLVA